MKSVLAPLALALLLQSLFCSKTNRPAADPVAPTPTASGPATAPAQSLSITALGEPYSLHIDEGSLTFCDQRGARMLTLPSGEEAASDKTCAKSGEPNTACSGFALDVAVRAPLSDPNDIVDVAGTSFPLRGRVHDCSTYGKRVAIVTGSAVVLIDVAKGGAREVRQEGGDRVTIGGGWIAWTEGSKVYVSSFE